MRRRELLALGFGVAVARAAAAEPGPELEQIDLDVGGDPKLARRVRLLVPKSGGEPWPLLVLLHGLGETKSAALGLSAWTERYGLVASYEALRRAPLARGKLGYLTEERRGELNRELARAPFRGFALACPVTPNVYERGPGSLDRYADWVEGTLLPAVQARAPVSRAPARTAIDGCSLGGYVALELFLRKPALFGCCGTLQGAFSPARAADYARRIADVARTIGPRRVRVGSSTRDPYRAAAEKLAAELGRRDVPHELSVAPGPHDQPWLREVGTLELLLWYDRALRAV